MNHNTVAVGGQPFPPELPCALILPADGVTHNFCYGQTNRQADGKTDRWTDRQMDRQTDGKTDRWTDISAL